MPGAIRFESEGSGRALVLLPGAACPPSIFAAASVQLRERYTLSAAAIAGFAGEPPVGSPLYPKLVDALVAHLERIGPAVLVGHSLGGTVALSAALEAPGLTLGVVLIEAAPALGPIVCGTEVLGEQGRWAERSRRRARDDDNYVADMVGAFEPMFCELDAFDAVRVAASCSDAESLADALAHAITLDLRPHMRDIAAPVLLVSGEWPHLDALSYEEEIWAQLEACPRRSRVTIPGTAHFPMAERPHVFVEALERFLREEVR